MAIPLDLSTTPIGKVGFPVDTGRGRAIIRRRHGCSHDDFPAGLPPHAAFRRVLSPLIHRLAVPDF
jgi:hypothetical protein